MKLRLNNCTRWDTRDFRRFVLTGLKEYAGDAPGYTYWVDVRTRRTYFGRGYLGRRHMMLYPLPPKDENDTIAGAALHRMAITVSHEFNHNIGLRHKEMDDSGVTVPWADQLIAEGFVIHAQKEVVKLPVDLQQKRYEHAQLMLAKNERRLKVAQKRVRVWRQKVRYYQRVMALRTAARSQ